MIRLRPSGVDEILIKRVQDWYEPGPGVFVQSLTASFSPAMLFTGTTTGAWYDPSDYTTLFQNAAGTTPVTAVEQPVGLMLDKSKGLVLGANVCTTSYPTTASVNGAFVARMGSVVAGTWYKLTYTVTASTLGNGGVLYLEPTGGPFAYQVVPSTIGTHTVYAYAADAELSQAGISLGGGPGITGSVTLSGCTIQAIPGNHAFNSSGNSANFPVLSARYNLLTKSEQFDDAVWTKSSCTITPNATTAPDGTLTADRAVFTAGGLLYANGLPATAGTYIFSGYVKSATGSTQTMRIFGNGTLSYSGDLPVTTEWTRVSFTFTYSAATSGFATSSGQPLDIYIWGADLRVSNDALGQPAYQRVNTSTDYDTVGFKPYLRFNGTNQWLQTNSIDFSYGDKMFVSAGVRKLSDAAVGIVAELSVSAGGGTSGTFVLHNQTAPTGWRYAAGSGASGAAFATDDASVFTAPTTNVVSGISDFAGATITDEINARVNGATPTQTRAGTVSTGNFGNYSLYIGGRGGSSLWFNGRLYGLVVAGKQASAAEITSTETYLNNKTGAF